MSGDGKDSIVLFPFMGQGHIIPFLALALHIEQTNPNLTIYLANTPSNINKLKSSLPPNSPIKFLEIPFPSSSHGLSPASENSDSLPSRLVIRLFQASASLEFKSSFEKAIRNITAPRPPICIISDFFFGWTATLAKQLGIYHVIFSASAAFGLACYYSLWLHLPHRNLAADEFPLVDFEEASIVLHKTQLPANIAEADGEDDWSVFQRENFSAWEDSNLLLFNTLEEFDQIGLSYFKRKFPRVDVRAISPLLLGSTARDRIGNTTGLVTREAILKWLDSKASSSVLYVSFGSMNTISSSQMMELGKALEGSGKDFIWVVRPPMEADINAEFKAGEWLPEGFEERNVATGRGLIVEKWAPQVEILSHRAVSGFVSHCGWNSAMEALSRGVAVMGWALAGEQFFNVKLLEEMGVCVEVARGKKSEVKSEDIVRRIEMVMDGNDRGNEMKRKAEEVMEKIHKASTGSSVQTIHDFLSLAKLHNKKIIS